MKIQKAIIASSLFALFVSAAQAQHSIKGKVTNSRGSIVENVVVSVQDKADLLQKATTDFLGNYSIHAINQENVSIRIEDDRFVPFEQAVILNNADTIIDITLEQKETSFKEITVTNKKTLFERKADRTIFNVQESIASAGSNALEMLKKAPGVVVQQQDYSIRLVGKSSVMVMINDRLLQLSAEDLFAYLQGIPSDNIARIEVITTPPSRYDASGNSGLVNIILKKNNKPGLNGDIRSGYEQSGYGTLLSGGNLNYRSGKLNVYSSAGYTHEAKNMVERMSTFYSDQTYKISDPYKRETDMLQLTLGADYQLSKKNIAGIQATGNLFNRIYSKANSAITITQNPGETIDSVIHTGGSALMQNNTETMNLNYVYDFDTAGKKLSVNANRLWYDGGRNSDYETSRFVGSSLQPSGNPQQYRNAGTQDIGITTAQADLELPGKKWNLNLGSKWSRTVNKSLNNFYNYTGNTYVNDTSISNEFHYKEQVEAFYISTARTIKKWEFQLGLRAEFTQTEGYSVKLNQRNNNRYFNLFPTGYLLYKMSDNVSFNLNYSKRIFRPGYRALDPYRSYSSPYSYIEGNPFLRPNLLHNFELGLTLKSNYTISAFFEYWPKGFGQTFFADSVKKISYVRMQEYGNFYYSGINFSAAFHFTKNLETQFQSNISISKVDVTYTETPVYGKLFPSLWFSINNSFPFNKSKTFLGQFNAVYYSSYLFDMMKREGQLNVDAGLKVILFDKKLVISLNSNDIFRTLKVKARNLVTQQTMDSYFDEQNVRLMLNYKFGNSTIKERRKRNSGIEEERQRT